MKKIPQTALTLIFVVATVVFFGVVQAEPPPPPQQYGQDTATCLPDCFNSRWSTPKVIKLDIPGFGSFWVKYRQRYACNIWYDVYIDWIIPVTTSSTDPFAGVSMQYILEIVTAKLLIVNPMQFPPLAGGPDSCRTNWRVIKGNCWGRVITQDPDCPHQYMPCDPVECCLEPYEVCLDLNGNRTVAKLSGWAPYTCGGQGGPAAPIGGDSCEPACGYPPQYY